MGLLGSMLGLSMPPTVKGRVSDQEAGPLPEEAVGESQKPECDVERTVRFRLRPEHTR